jgi:hypothetical protein
MPTSTMIIRNKKNKERGNSPFLLPNYIISCIVVCGYN